MIDWCKFRLYQFANSSIGKRVVLPYYKLAIMFTAWNLKRIPWVESVYLKGSFGKKHFVPLVSDLDFFIIGTNSKENYTELERIFRRLHFIFPMVEDFDFHEKEVAKVLLEYSGYKFLDVYSWEPLFGEKLKFNYNHNQRKYVLDVVHEIFFQFEWLFKNLQRRKVKDKYRSVVIHRQYIKVSHLILSLGETLPSQPRAIKSQVIWEVMSNESILDTFNLLVEGTSLFQRLHSIYLKEMRTIDFDQIIKLDYYQKNLSIIQDDTKYQGKFFNLTRFNFELFYLLGCIDSYQLYEWLNSSRDIHSKEFIRRLYYTRILEGRTNDVHNREWAINEIFQSQPLPTCFSTGGRLLYSHQKTIVIPALYRSPEIVAKIKTYIKDFSELETDFSLIIYCFGFIDSSLEELTNYRVQINFILENNTFSIPANDILAKKYIVEWNFLSDVLFFSDLKLTLTSTFLKSLTKFFENNPGKVCLPYKSIQYLDCRLYSPLAKNSEVFYYNLYLREYSFMWAAEISVWNQIDLSKDLTFGAFVNEVFSYLVSSKFPNITRNEYWDSIDARQLDSLNLTIEELDFNLEVSEQSRISYINLESALRLNLKDNILRANENYILFYLDLSKMNETEHKLMDIMSLGLNENNILDFNNNIAVYLKHHKEQIIKYPLSFTDSNEPKNYIESHSNSYAYFKKIKDGFKAYAVGLSTMGEYTLSFLQEITADVVPPFIFSFSVIPQERFSGEMYDVALLPEESEENQIQIPLQEIKDLNFYITPSLDYIPTKFLIQSHIKLKNNLSYEFKLDSFHSLSKFEFKTFYKKLELKAPPFHVNLNEFHRGLYKFVIHPSMACAGEVIVRAQGSDIISDFKMKQQRVHIFYYFINQYNSNITLDFLFPLESDLVIDCLKEDGLT